MRGEIFSKSLCKVWRFFLKCSRDSQKWSILKVSVQLVRDGFGRFLIRTDSLTDSLTDSTLVQCTAVKNDREHIFGRVPDIFTGTFRDASRVLLRP